MPVRLDQLTKRFDATVAVDRVSLAIRPGELLVVAGAPGSGKSTLLRLLAGMDEPSGGAVVAGEMKLVAGAADRPIAFGSLAGAGASGAGALDGTSASGVAGPLPAGPDSCLLLDEPLASLRGPERTAARDELRALPATSGAAVVCAMDAGDEADALAVADRIAVLHEGRLRQCGTPAEVVDAPADEVVATFFGRPRINLVPAILEKDGQAILLGNQTVSLAGRIDETFCRDVTLGIRPEHVRLTQDGAGLRGRVRSTEPGDGSTLVQVTVEGVSIRAADPGGAPLRAGDAVRMRVDPRRYIVFDDQGVRLEQR
ncbi:MAG: ATP-binding cassette domain-containing protein [Acidobacteria bacterium]|nr:ATP-binding cassette domain-containing protein [Acidobacteriota bacterium]